MGCSLAMAGCFLLCPCLCTASHVLSGREATSPTGAQSCSLFPGRVTVVVGAVRGVRGVLKQGRFVPVHSPLWLRPSALPSCMLVLYAGCMRQELGNHTCKMENADPAWDGDE